ncbi:1-phosphofructokinase family hexose kinase [Microbacterium sp. VKM Ac-2923]|uniref:1-phosphofructokinase family hexose kinase n=1 Tax=Microbacterium sp. VKM Ac-2923 TaxID=2929476 RepID=UPI001FB366CD|nr:PfkB family carbohydrate kinase [Microbacterium sp. VKM Ac-2923]MCJ1707863.1 PfkB family carbohydrate kinase [Microbacterium sp. VKM Ac-2923]
MTGIVTLTAAGAIDATYRIGTLRRGSFTRAESYTREVSGKGVNVSAALAAGGADTAAVVVLGADDVRFARAGLTAPLLRIVEVPGATRVNTSIIDADGATTKVNAPTPPLSLEAWDATISALSEELADRTEPWLVISGSLPELAGTGALVDLAAVRAVARQHGARIAVDTSGSALDALLADPVGIDLLTPNAEELSAAVWRPLHTLGDVVAAAREIVARGVTTVLASLGADGLVAVTADRAVFARANAPSVANTAGAGDAALAGFLLGLAREPAADADPLAVAAASAAEWGAHAVAHASTIVAGPPVGIRAVVETSPDLSRVLTEEGEA